MGRIAGFAFAVWVSIGGAATAATYQVADLGRGYSSEIHDFSGSILVGNVGVGNSAKAVTFSTTADRLFLSAGANDNSGATAVNSDGAIVGWSEINAANAFINDYKHAVIWTGGTRLQFDEPVGATNSYAIDINNAGVAVGSWDTLSRGTLSNVDMHAARWNADRTVVDLSSAGETASEAFSINNSGVAVGYRKFTGGSSGERAVVWSASNTLTVLPTLVVNGSGRALVVNDAGLIGGITDNGSGVRVPFVYDGSLRTLATVSGATFYNMFDISSSGAIVGSATVDGTLVPLLWADGQVFDLRTLAEPFISPTWGPLTLQQATAIDELGRIAANGSSPSSFAADRAVFLVPEPSAALPILLAVLCLASRRRLGRRIPG